MVELANEFIGRDARFTVPLLEFQFQFILPRPRIEILITLRDQLGRIINSVAPQVVVA